MSILKQLRQKKIFRQKEDLELTDGPLKENLFYLALPIVVFNLLQTVYGLIDTFWLGRLSDNALAAFSIVFPAQFLLISLGLGISVAGSVMVAQYEGAGKSSKIKKAASQTITYSLIASLVIGVIGVFSARTLVTLLGAEAATVPVATAFLQIISLGFFSIVGFQVFTALMRAYGDPITPMAIMIVTVLLNVVLDPALIFGWWIFPQMGAVGAAYVTIFLRSLGLLTGLAILFRGRDQLQISLPLMRPQIGFLKKILNIGVPATAESIGRSLAVNLVVAVVGLFGTAVMGGFGIGIRIFSVVFLPAVAVDRAVETMTGQNLGAGKFNRANEIPMVASKFSFLLLTLIGILAFIFPVKLASFFTTDQEIVRVSAEFIRWNALSFGFIGLIRGFSGAFRGAGKTILPAILAVGIIGFMRLPMAYYFSRVMEMGPQGIWMSFPISNVVGGLSGLALYFLLDWKQQVD